VGIPAAISLKCGWGLLEGATNWLCSRGINGIGAVVIDFFATWCGPCKRIAPAFEDLADKYYPAITFLKVDVDQCPELVNVFDISAMPTFVFLKDGKILKKIEGADMRALNDGFSLLTQ
jgi:thioredoxin 1